MTCTVECEDCKGLKTSCDESMTSSDKGTAIGLPEGAAAWQLGLITTLCALLGWLIYAAYALVFSTGRAMDSYARARRWVEGACALVFCLAGFRMLTWRAAP